MMTQGEALVEKLRDTPCNRPPFTPAHADCQCRTANAAADEIERLRAALQEAERDARKWRLQEAKAKHL